jgi:cytochrome c peroxidase
MKRYIAAVCGAALILSFGCGKAQPKDDNLRKCWADPDKPGVILCGAQAPVDIFAPPPGPPVVNPRALQRFAPLRPDFQKADKPASRELVDLGRVLYYDARLSRTGTMSCNTCHPLEKYGATEEATNVGVDGKHGSRNAPTVYNAAGQFALFWDGRSKDVEEQALMPLLNPMEMGASSKSVLATLNSVQGYTPLFKAAFPADTRPITLKNVGIAIGAFERGLATPSRWDRYLRGNLAALSDKEKEGLRVFTTSGCMVCHTGELVGGTMYEKLGAAVAWPSAKDHGRGAVTHNPADDMMFKVPSLRNVARTAPYFHDGSAKTLEDAVKMMADSQLGQPLTDTEVSSVVAWLNALTGDLPLEYIRAPELPGDRLAQSL